MTDTQKNQILELKKQGLGYKAIAKQLSVPVSSVSSFIKRSEENKKKESICKCCGIPMKQTPGHRQKTFCCSKCKVKWWKEHPEERRKSILVECLCPVCNKAFMAYLKKHRKYCSWTCYSSGRRGDSND